MELSHEVVVSFMRWLFHEAMTSFSLLALSLLHIIKNPMWHCMGRPMGLLTCTNVLALTSMNLHSPNWSPKLVMVCHLGPYPFGVFIHIWKKTLGFYLLLHPRPSHCPSLPQIMPANMVVMPCPCSWQSPPSMLRCHLLPLGLDNGGRQLLLWWRWHRIIFLYSAILKSPPPPPLPHPQLPFNHLLISALTPGALDLKSHGRLCATTHHSSLPWIPCLWPSSSPNNHTDGTYVSSWTSGPLYLIVFFRREWVVRAADPCGRDGGQGDGSAQGQTTQPSIGENGGPAREWRQKCKQMAPAAQH
jgi:hypothetical protein